MWIAAIAAWWIASRERIGRADLAPYSLTYSQALVMSPPGTDRSYHIFTAAVTNEVTPFGSFKCGTRTMKSTTAKACLLPSSVVAQPVETVSEQ
jgi:hypothetical protein